MGGECNYSIWTGTRVCAHNKGERIRNKTNRVCSVETYVTFVHLYPKTDWQLRPPPFTIGFASKLASFYRIEFELVRITRCTPLHNPSTASSCFHQW